MSQYRPVIKMFLLHFSDIIGSYQGFFHILTTGANLISIFNFNHLRQKRNEINEVFRWKNK